MDAVPDRADARRQTTPVSVGNIGLTWLGRGLEQIKANAEALKAACGQGAAGAGAVKGERTGKEAA
jgi:hypothetical protein